jgi:hypothetical protein
MADGGTTIDGIPSSTTNGADGKGDEVGLRGGPEVDEGNAAGVVEGARTVAEGDDGGGLTVVAQAATSAAQQPTSRRILRSMPLSLGDHGDGRDGHGVGVGQRQIVVPQERAIFDMS